MSANHVPAPVVILSADVLCVEVHKMIDNITNFKTYSRFEQLRAALNAYSSARFDDMTSGGIKSEPIREYIQGEHTYSTENIAICDPPAPETLRTGEARQ